MRIDFSEQYFILSDDGKTGVRLNTLSFPYNFEQWGWAKLSKIQETKLKSFRLGPIVIDISKEFSFE